MFSERVMNLKPSATVRISDLAAKLKREGKDVISFSMGAPDFDTPQNIKDAAKGALDRGLTSYSPAFGIPEFREAVAEKSKKDNGIDCAANNVIITPSKHAIFMSVLTLVNKGEEVLLPDPAWVTYDPCVTVAEGKSVMVPTKKHDHMLKADRVAELVTEKTKAIILNTPNNPTGAVYEEAELKGIVDLAEDHDFYIISDEVYEKIIYEGKHFSMASYGSGLERVITVNGLSKSHAMPGWRIGWLIASDDIMKKIGPIQQHSVTCSPIFTQIGGVEALRGPQDDMKKMWKEFRARRDIMAAGLNKTGIFKCQLPAGGLYLFPEILTDEPSMEFSERLLSELGIAATPGSAFGKDGEGHLRFCHARGRSEIEKALERLENNKIL